MLVNIQKLNILFIDFLDCTWITTLFTSFFMRYYYIYISINVHSHICSCSKPVNKVKAASQWQALRETFNNLGLETDICPAAPGILSFGNFPSDKNYLNSRLLTVKYICTKISISFYHSFISQQSRGSWHGICCQLGNSAE